MNTFPSQVFLSGVVGGLSGAFVNGIAGYLSKDDEVEFQRRLVIGVVAGAAIVALGTAIALSNNTGAVLGTLVGLIYIMANFGYYDRWQDDKIRRMISDILPRVAVCAGAGYLASRFIG